MLSHRESLWLLLKAVFTSLGTFSALLFAILFAIWGSLGPTPTPETEWAIRLFKNWVDPYRVLIAFILFGLSAHLATRKAISQDRKTSQQRIAELERQNVNLTHRRDELEDLLQPRAEIVLVPGCCVQASNVRIGVAGKPVKSLLTAAVYVDVPALGMSDKILAWEHPTPDPERSIDIHHGRHHHTTWFATVGSQPGQFFVTFG